MKFAEAGIFSRCHRFDLSLINRASQAARALMPLAAAICKSPISVKRSCIFAATLICRSARLESLILQT
jgi:hypothetical protein